MKLEEYRKEIDALDKEIIKLLNQRIECVKKIGEYKRKNEMPVLDTSREQEIYDKIKMMDIPNTATVSEIYKEIMKITKAIQ